MTQWDKKVVLITGGSRGIGAAMVQHFLALGSQVITTSTSAEGAQSIIDKQANPRLSAMVLNLSQPDSIEEVLKRLKEDGSCIDILINNAGMTDDRLSIQITPKRWADLLDTNLSGTFFFTQGILKSMLRARYGRIVFLSSVVALTGNPGQASYCAAKAGLIGLMKSLALEVASRSITINTIAPGWIESDMTAKLTVAQKELALAKIPMRHFGSGQDIAAACEFLVSDEAKYITGHTLHVNGGIFLA